MRLEIVVGNIVKQPDLEALVNSANANLRLGSGVAGAIHTAAGPRLEEYCKPYAPLAYGSFLVTPGFKLPNPWVIHVRAASYTNYADAPLILEQALGAMLKAANDNHLRSIGFPAIGTGVFAFPPELAASIPVRVLARNADIAPHLQLARLCVSDADLLAVYRDAFEAAGLHVHTAASGAVQPSHS